MIRFFFLSVFLFILYPVTSHAQYSIKADILPPVLHKDDRNTGYQQISIHYFTRLKRYRLQFQPGIHFQYYPRKEFPFVWGPEIPVAVYPLDFINDCNCPTFSKAGTWFKKGLFLRITPAYSFHLHPGEEDPGSFFSTGMDAGIDWGISDVITLSPFLGYKYHHLPKSTDGSHHYLQLGFHLLFRHDYSRRNR